MHESPFKQPTRTHIFKAKTGKRKLHSMKILIKLQRVLLKALTAKFTCHETFSLIMHSLDKFLKQY